MNPLPMVNVKAVADVSGGLTKSAKRDTMPLQRPYVTVANVYADRLVLHGLDSIGVRESELARVELRRGDLLVVEGNGSLGQLGRVALWNGAVPGCVHQNHLIKVRPKAAVSPRWLLFWLLSPQGRAAIEAVGSSTSGLHTLSISKVEMLPVPIESLAHQDRIVGAIDAHFSRLDAAVASLSRAEANVKRARASVLLAAVEGRLVPTEAALARAEGRDYEPASALLARILAERKAAWAASGARGKYMEAAGPLSGEQVVPPEGWCYCTVDQCAMSVGYGTSAKCSDVDGGVPVLRMGNIVDGRLDLSALKYLPHDHPEFPQQHLQDGNLLFNRTNSPELVGKSAVYKGRPHPCACASYLIRLALSPGVLPDYVNTAINSPHGRHWIRRVASQQVGQANVNGTKLRSYAFPLPPLAEQRRIVGEVDRRLSVLDAIDASIDANLARCVRLRQSILQRAFEGRLVPAEPLSGDGQPYGPISPGASFAAEAG